jgi:hypothetical protein
MEQPTNILAQSLSDRLTTIAHRLRQILGAPDYARLDLSLKWAIWHRLTFLARRFHTLATNPHPRRPHRAAPTPEPPPEASAPTATTPQKFKLPRRKGWLLQVLPGHLVPFVRSHLIALLADPEMMQLLRENPRIGRVLRPMCTMLAIPLAEDLKLPQKPRPPRPPRPKPPPKPEPTLYQYLLEKYPPPPPCPKLPGHLYEPARRVKISFER